jgi:leucyl-tRNA synthetase
MRLLKLTDRGTLFRGLISRSTPDRVAFSDIPTDTQPVSAKDAVAPTTSTSTGNVDKSKKSKVNAKSTGLTYQFQIVRLLYRLMWTFS